MAIVKEITIKVNVDEASVNVKKLENNLGNLSKKGESIDLSDGLNKSSEAMGILDSKTKGLASGFVKVAKAAKLGGKAMKSALISSGIGVLLVIVSEIASNWDSIVGFIEGANDEFDEQVKLNREVNDALNHQLKVLKLQRDTLKNSNKSTKAIDKTIKDTLKSQLIQLELNLKILKEQIEIEKSKAIELSLWDKIKVSANGLLGQVELLSESEKKQAKERKEQYEKRVLEIENIKKKLSGIDKDERDRFNKAKKDREKLEDDKYKQFLKDSERNEKLNKQKDAQAEKDRQQKLQDESDSGVEEEDTIIEEDKRIIRQAKIDEKLKEYRELTTLEKIAEEERNALNELAKLEATEAEKQKIRDFYDNKRKTKKEQDAKKEEQLKQNTENAKLNIANQTAGLIGQLVEKDSALGKGVAVAQATISGFQGVQNAYTTAQSSPITTLFPAYPLIQAGLAGAFSAIQIKKILSVNPKTGKGASGGSTGSGGQSAPSFNLVAGSGSNQIAEGLSNQDTPIRAYVTSGDMTTSQALDRNIVENSSL